MNPFKGLFEAVRVLVGAINRAARAFDSLAQEIEERSEQHSVKDSNGVQARTKAKV